MKKIILILFLLSGSFPARSQMGYFFGELVINLFTTWQEGGYELKYTGVNNSSMYLHGIRGGWFLNADRTSLLGVSMVGGYTTINSYSVLRRQEIVLAYGTVYYEHNFQVGKNIQFSPLLHIGMGAVSIDQYRASSEWNWSQLFIAEPNANFNLRLFPFMKIGAGLGMRFLGGVKLEGGSNLSLGGPSANLFIKFGNYRDESE